MDTQQQPIGAPVWFELASTDQDAATRFYAALLGWAPVDHEIAEGGRYTIFARHGREVAACYSMMEAERAQGVPSHWAVYFRVSDCDATVARARSAGATVAAEPFEVPGQLRMAVLQDPDGAYFCIAQLRQHRGVGVIHEVGTVGWVELATRDVERAGAFYSALFGWELEEHAGPSPSRYRVFSVAGEKQGGLLEMTAEWGDIPSHWSIYLRVDDVDRTLARATELGGATCVPPFDVPGVGRIARMQDCTGGGAYLIALEAR